MLERSRYTLLKMEDEWEEAEKETMAHLFDNYPVLKTAYRLSQKLRLWYASKNIGTHPVVLEQGIYKWYDEVDRSNISAFKGVRKMIEKHQDDIMNYFKNGRTNAKAENMNGKNAALLRQQFRLFSSMGHPRNFHL